MTHPSKMFVLSTTILGVGIGVALAAHILSAGQAQTSRAKQPAAMEPVAALTPFVDAHYYPELKSSEQRWQTVVLLFNQFPADVRRKIGTENILHIFPGKPAASSANAVKN